MNRLELKQLANHHGLEILENTFKINEQGVDFRVAHVEDLHGDQWILRMPRRPESMKHALQEKKTLDHISKQVHFQVPKWSIFTESLIAYKQLEGVPAASIDVEQQSYVWSFDQTNVPQAYYESLGSVLANVHSLDQQPFKTIGVEMLSAHELRASMKQRMERVKSQYTINSGLWERWQAWLAKDSLWPPFVGVKHGDLHPGHILIDENQCVTGVIDWSEVGVGDVSADFLSHQLLFGKEGLTKLIHAYEKAGGRTWSRMDEHIKELLTTSAITVAEYAQRSGLKDMHETAADMLANER
ncbi:Mph(B) family macrolide 2'-phosphotransferase [Bacillus sp. NMCC46]|uniref:macrolide 2'-phosphotransferase n=1 Tax=unclassified Bacillus (in: firmicutes) TaxID=185979 RepID=UPI000D03ED53|nr:macrolide 2'-phosphotransferase [Bacillus sp. NMCC46]PRS45548.1 Mph(B) family macrolide 2'-phosphotransferase [Bacillus sp. NMCC46]